MKRLAIVAGMCLLAWQIGANAWAEEKGEKSDWHKMMSEEHSMHQETLKMLKGTMTILRTMNHQPSESDQKRLKEMEDRLDKIMTREDEMMKSHSMMHEKGGMPGKGMTEESGKMMR